MINKLKSMLKNKNDLLVREMVKSRPRVSEVYYTEGYRDALKDVIKMMEEKDENV